MRQRKMDKVYTRAVGFFITQLEGLKEQVNIARCNEIAKHLPEILRTRYTQKAVLQWIRGKK